MVVVDLLRASTTIVHALHAGAISVVPCRTPEQARAIRSRASGQRHLGRRVVLGGERHGVRIDGFDLGNSPFEYTADSVGGATVAFTTTNGTNAILQSSLAGCVVMGCYANLAKLVQELVAAGRPVHISCAGTNGLPTLEDCLFAGRLAHELACYGLQRTSDDESFLAEVLYQHARREPNGELVIMRSSRGGQNLIAIGYEADIELCRREDTCPIVPVYYPSTGEVRHG